MKPPPFAASLVRKEGGREVHLPPLGDDVHQRAHYPFMSEHTSRSTHNIEFGGRRGTS